MVEKVKDPNKQSNGAFTVAIVVFCCFLLGSLLFLNGTKLQNEQRGIQYILDATSQRQMALDQQIESDLQILRGVAVGLDEIDLNNKDLLLTLLDGVNRTNNFVQMGLVGMDGFVDLVDLDGTVYTNVDFSEMDFFLTALEGGDGVSETRLSSVTGFDVNYYATPVYQDGVMKGVLCAVNPGTTFFNIVNVPVFQGEGYFLVTDSIGTIVLPGEHEVTADYTSNITQALVFDDSEKAKLLQAMASGDSGSYRANQDGENMLVANQPLNYNGWHILGIISHSDVTAYQSRTVIGIITVIFSACLLIILLLLWQKHMMNHNKKSLEKLAYYDALTGTMNLTKFLLDADILLDGKEGSRKYAVWSFDIKKFTYINEVFGVGVGDQVLKQIASLFERIISNYGIFCRVSADLFAGLLFYSEKQDLHDWAKQLWIEMERQEFVPASKMRIDSAIGFYCSEDYFEEQHNTSNMVNWASMARKEAKQLTGNNIGFFTKEMSERVRWEAELEVSGKEALTRDDITFFLQPKVNIQKDCVISGAEVLARWNHPFHGWLSPAEFIPLFEKNGFIVELDRHIFNKACEWYAYKYSPDKPKLQLAVNVSRQGLLQEDFLEYYSDIKQRYGIPDGVLELEFTESVVWDDYDLFQCFVSKLQKRGFLCSIDDFGAGYSSLNMLKSLTIDVLKLDAVFFRDGLNTKREQTVISHFIHMARDLGIITVAEGVETDQQVSFLQHAGCDSVQGHYYSKPLPIKEFERLVIKTGGNLSSQTAE